MSQVFIITEHRPDDGDSIIKVCSTMDIAIEEMDTYVKNDRYLNQAAGIKSNGDHYTTWAGIVVEITAHDVK